MTVGERILGRLKELRMSQAELARRVKLHQSTINGLVKGGHRSTPHLHNIARELGTTAEYLAGQTDDPGSHVPSLELSGEDQRFLDLFRKCTLAEKSAVMTVMKLFVRS